MFRICPGRSNPISDEWGNIEIEGEALAFVARNIDSKAIARWPTGSAGTNVAFA